MVWLDGDSRYSNAGLQNLLSGRILRAISRPMSLNCVITQHIRSGTRADMASVAFENRDAHRQVALQSLDRRAEHECGADVELFGHLALPLLGQMWRTQNGHPRDLTAIQQLARD